MKAVLSLSGGMDSTALLANLLAAKHEVYIISFNYGQKHNIELERATANVKMLKEKGFSIIEHKIVDMSWIKDLFHSNLLQGGEAIPEGHYAEDNMKQTVVPNRNAIFSSVVFGYALSIATKEREPIKICLGVHSGDHAIYPDCRPEFYNAIGEAFAIGNWESDLVHYYLPFMEFDKYRILKDGIESCGITGIDFFELFHNTSTCYNPSTSHIPEQNGLACGKCGSCTERLEAFAKLALPDPIEYQMPYAEALRGMMETLNITPEDLKVED